MDDFLKIIVTILIEIIFYCTIPLLIRLINKKPLKNKTSWYLAIVNFALVFTISKLIISKIINIDYNTINPDLVSLLLIPVNYYILKFEVNKETVKKKKVDNKNNKLLIIICIVLIVIMSVIFIISNNNKNVKDDKQNNNVNNNYSIKFINSQSDFNNVISNDNYTIVLFDYINNPFHESTITTIKDIINDYKLNNFYYYDVTNGNIDAKIDLDKLPNVVIYKNNKYIAQKVGYTDKQEMKELFYRNDIVGLLSNNNIID